ncbi:Dabb family protein [Amycolatopsis palatopharyngis]|uniref:Dabb family protein n=1 Tax=Amycolatopsis palatopharyngis TaxID=187982 RepID=UPI000E248879|nr:Dabb family protein [Amycolatopsis palatopharyngis]
MIRHTVAFRLRHAPGSDEERQFLKAALALADIPGVERFEQLRQTSPKNDFRFGFSMEFADQTAYTNYNEHPVHTGFVAERWLTEVEDFLEIDYEPLD